MQRLARRLAVSAVFLLAGTLAAEPVSPELAQGVGELKAAFERLRESRNRLVAALIERAGKGGDAKHADRRAETDLPDDPLAAARRMAVASTYAYQEARAADLFGRYEGLTFPDALQMAAFSVPEWGLAKAMLGADAAAMSIESVKASRFDLKEDLGDTPDMEWLDLEDLPRAKRYEPPKQERALTAADVAAMRDYVLRLRRRIDARFEALGRRDSFVVGSLDMADPFFGPYFGDLPLATNAQGAALLPADAGAAGAQDWRFIPLWHAAGPFVANRKPAWTTPLLPDLVPAPGAAYVPNAEALGLSYDQPQDGLMRWVAQRSLNRFVPPPAHRFRTGPPKLAADERPPPLTVGVHGVRSALWYATASVRAEREAELYLSAAANRDGRLWINGELVWDSHGAGRARGPRWGVVESRHPVLFTARFRKGDNELLFGCRSGSSVSWFSLILCARGQPLSPEQRTAMRQGQLAARRNLPPDPRRGGRGGNFTSGAFPDAEPPLWWDVEQGINLRWRTPLPDYSAGTPVIAGDRVFVNCEPHTLYCLDAKTGEILWRRESNILEFIPDEKERRAAMVAWAAERSKSKSPQEEKLEAELAEQERVLADLREKTDPSEQKIEQLEQRIAGIRRKLEALTGATGAHRRWLARFGLRSPGWSNNYGWTFASPATDGKYVWFKSATGVAACYDLDGNRRWMVRTHMSGGVPQLPSPFVIEGMLIVPGQLDEERQEQLLERVPDALPHLAYTILGLDAATGEQVWARPVSGIGGYGGQAGCCPVIVTDGRRTREVLATSTGMIIDPRDGRLLCNPLGLGLNCWHEAPFSVDNRVYWQRSDYIRSAELWLEDNGRIGGKPVVVSEYGIRWASASYVDGYAVWSRPGLLRGRRSRVPSPIHSFEQCEMSTGKGMPGIEAALDAGGLGYTPAASAGPFAVVCGTGPGPAAWAIDPNGSAQIGFVRPGPSPYVVCTAELGEPMVAAPVFEGNAMYVRTYASVMCIAADTDAGRREMLRHKADALFATVPAEPLQYGVWEIEPATGLEPPSTPPEKFAVSTTPRRWWRAGPLAPDPDRDPLALPGTRTLPVSSPGRPLTYAGRNYRFEPLGAEAATDEGLDVAVPEGAAPGSLVCLSTLLHNPADRVVHVTLQAPPEVRVWLAGQWIRNDNTIRIQTGAYPLMVYSRAAGPDARLRLTFEEPDVFREWKPTIRAFRPQLEEIVNDLPGSERARRAAAMLALGAE